jgi:hypothetical protein
VNPKILVGALAAVGLLASCASGDEDPPRGERDPAASEPPPADRGVPPEDGVARPPSQRVPDPGRFPPSLRALGMAWPVQGLQAPGAKLSPSLTLRPGARRVDDDVEASLALVEVTAKRRPIRVVRAHQAAVASISERRPLTFEATVPDKVPARYALTLEFLRGGRAIDRYATYFEVPEQRVDALLRLDRMVVRRGERSIGATLQNRGPVPLRFGAEYRLERRKLGVWMPVHLDIAFPLILLGLEPRESERFEVYLPEDLKPGRYRVSKSVEGLGTDIRSDLHAEFRVL